MKSDNRMVFRDVRRLESESCQFIAPVGTSFFVRLNSNAAHSRPYSAQRTDGLLYRNKPFWHPTSGFTQVVWWLVLLIHQSIQNIANMFPVMVARDVVVSGDRFYADPFQSGFDSQHRQEHSWIEN